MPDFSRTEIWRPPFADLQCTWYDQATSNFKKFFKLTQNLLRTGPRGDHVAAVRRQGRSLVPRDDRFPMPHRQGTIPGSDTPGTEDVLREECQPGAKVSLQSALLGLEIKCCFLIFPSQNSSRDVQRDDGPADGTTPEERQRTDEL